ncbi:MAG: amidase family protein [Bacilli bacterium]
MIKLALKSFIALKDPYSSIIKCFPLILKQASPSSSYMGLKDGLSLDEKRLDLYQKNGFLLHTIDKASHAYRAIDIDLINPLTTKAMSGSSSGSALNVFIGINDIALASDGGGSVLAPAANLNLYGFISPLIPNNFTSKSSTDGLIFKPSYGYIAKSLALIKQAVSIDIDLDYPIYNASILCFNDLPFFKEADHVSIDHLASRIELIKQMQGYLDQYDAFIIKEGPIDLYGLGDGIIGSFDHVGLQLQQAGNKGLLRIINMLGCTGLIIPSSELATGYLLFTKSTPQHIALLFHLSKSIPTYQNDLVKKYFNDIEYYFN